MNYDKQFLRDFSDWVDQQIQVNQMAMNMAAEVAENDDKAEAAEAVIRYESRLDAYLFLQGKFENYAAGKDFHDMPDLKLDKY